MARIALCIVATGRYIEFVPSLLDEASRYFLPGQTVMPFLFSDTQPSPPGPSVVDFAYRWIPTPFEPWPAGTYRRYHYCLAAGDELSQYDYLYRIDADVRIVDFIGDEILSDLVATEHHGYVGHPSIRLPFDRRRKTLACVPHGQGTVYYCGAFQGGTWAGYGTAMRAIADAIDHDEANGVTAQWWDESHWNAYLAKTPPTLSLDWRYCAHDVRPHEGAKIIAITKDHAAYRSPSQ